MDTRPRNRVCLLLAWMTWPWWARDADPKHGWQRPRSGRYRYLRGSGTMAREDLRPKIQFCTYTPTVPDPGGDRDSQEGRGGRERERGGGGGARGEGPAEHGMCVLLCVSLVFFGSPAYPTHFFWATKMFFFFYFLVLSPRRPYHSAETAISTLFSFSPLLFWLLSTSSRLLFSFCPLCRVEPFASSVLALVSCVCNEIGRAAVVIEMTPDLRVSVCMKSVVASM